mgnify:CR=1 FL=1
MVIKMKDLIKAQNDILREKFVHRRLNEAEPPPAGGGEDKPPEPQKLKIDIPDTPFEPDVNQVKDRLKQILQSWKKFGKANPNDIVNLIKYLDGEK